MNLWRKVLTVFFLCITFPLQVKAQEAPWVSAAAAILLEASTGQVLYAKNAHQERPPASTTKIVTAILGLELGRLDGYVKVSKYAASTPGASIDLVPGVVLRLEDLLKGALLSSGNDATVAIAEHLAGSEETFAWLMNRKAVLLGAFRSRFVNPNGLPAEGHYVTAYDLAVITRYALAHPLFSQMVKTRQAEIMASDGPRYLYNTNRLLGSYPGADGVKTGTTNAAGQCLVASATRNGRQLIAVVLRSDDRYEDASNLLDYGFNSFYLEKVREGQRVGTVYVRNGQKQEIGAVASREVAWAVPKDKISQLEKRVILYPRVKAPVQKGQVVGRIVLLYQGKEVSSADLVAEEGVPAERRLIPFWKW
ncbi:MAG: D-alanyl-D-alanine carboxypeptidase [Thermanaeromonas sp.]|uniref:D-alanyl-D-alanine carboxypeptidase family protein n=1 Tax=Thermanaeromonas sp. TaxID=2003697 RepID=UPI00243FCFCA|nr:D-alanyl-D-alanine carboxypeptidase family protein [Thermanaeromonas sp.]MCG0277271.1 D-alanyl-D-alanine carboxypeptidase [Thermanaeromonas sp.]